MENERQKRQENERVPNDDPPRPIQDPPVGDDEPDPTEPEGDPKPDVSPIKLRPNRAHAGGESIIEHARRTCRMCGRLFRHESDLVDHEITLHPNVGPLKVGADGHTSKSAEF
jgi:hypothetical protein